MSSEIYGAGILVTITDFKPAGAIATTSASFSKANVLLVGTAAGQVSQVGGVNTPIRVDRNATVDLVFRVESAPGDDNTYNPVGISFFEGDATIGLDDFPVRTVTADAFRQLVLVVRDRNIRSASYKFSLMIQEAKTGQIGIIDPLIENA